MRVILDCHEPVALHAVAATVAMFHNQVGLDLTFPDRLKLLHAGVEHELHYARKISDDPEISLVLDNPWYKKALTCIHHNATIGRLSLYGLSRDDILLAKGTPTLAPSKIKGRKFEFSVTSDVVDLITFERGYIPKPKPSFRNIQEAPNIRDRLSLAEFAQYWYELSKNPGHGDAITVEHRFPQRFP